MGLHKEKLGLGLGIGRLGGKLVLVYFWGGCFVCFCEGGFLTNYGGASCFLDWGRVLLGGEVLLRSAGLGEVVFALAFYV